MPNMPQITSVVIVSAWIRFCIGRDDATVAIAVAKATAVTEASTAKTSRTRIVGTSTPRSR